MTVWGSHRLTSVDPDLVRVVELVGSRRDVCVAQGARSVADEQDAINRGASHLRDPMDSLHVINPGVRDYALAVDLTPWPVDWQNHQSFVDLAADVKAAAAELGVTPFSWGGDWVHPFDFDHFQRAPAP
jgi:D-alanyl-D-alanine carboxypeptidase